MGGGQTPHLPQRNPVNHYHHQHLGMEKFLKKGVKCLVLLLIFRVKPIPHKPVIHIHIPNGGKTHRSGGLPCFHAPDLCRFFLLPAVVIFAQFRWQIKRCGSDSRLGRVALIVPRLLRFSIEVLSALLNTTASKRTARMSGNGCR